MSIDTLLENIRRDKEARLKFLAANDYSDSAIYIAAESAGFKQRSLELKMLYHLKELRELGNTDQKDKFDSTFFRSMNRKNDGVRKNR